MSGVWSKGLKRNDYIKGRRQKEGKADRRNKGEKFNKLKSERREVQPPYGITSGEDGER